MFVCVHACAWLCTFACIFCTCTSCIICLSILCVRRVHMYALPLSEPRWQQWGFIVPAAVLWMNRNKTLPADGRSWLTHSAVSRFLNIIKVSVIRRVFCGARRLRIFLISTRSYYVLKCTIVKLVLHNTCKVHFVFIFSKFLFCIWVCS